MVLLKIVKVLLVGNVLKDSNWNSYWGNEKQLEHWQKPAESVLDLIKSVDPAENPKVLDIGCGIGRHSIAFATKDFKVFALDGSEEALNDLKIRMENAELNIDIVKSDYRKQIFLENSFDIILSYNVIYHGLKEDFERAVELCKRCLKKDGIFFFTCPTR